MQSSKPLESNQLPSQPQKPCTSSASRMLTPFEIEQLRRDGQAAAEMAYRVFLKDRS